MSNNSGACNYYLSTISITYPLRLGKKSEKFITYPANISGLYKRNYPMISTDGELLIVL